MATDWYLLQYTPDLRRREPLNVGVVVDAGEDFAMRVVGMNAQGAIDGRQVRRFSGLTADAMREWVGYYQRAITRGDWDRALTLHLRRRTPFAVVRGGTDLSNRAAREVATSLFEDLVANRSTERKDYLALLHQRTETALKLADLTVEQDVVAAAQWDDGTKDQVTFDYRHENGQVHFMHRLQLHQASPDQSKNLALAFNASVVAAMRAGAAKSFTAFYSQEVIDEIGDGVLRPIWSVANTVNVDDQNEAVDSLRELVGA